MIYAWEAKHTVIEGRKLTFDGKAIELFGNWIKWLLLTIITIGIYGFWARLALKNGALNIYYLLHNKTHYLYQQKKFM